MVAGPHLPDARRSPREARTDPVWIDLWQQGSTNKAILFALTGRVPLCHTTGFLHAGALYAKHVMFEHAHSTRHLLT